MAALTPYHIQFHSALHRGVQGVSLEEAGVIVPSDTLFSALVDLCRSGGVEPTAFAAPFAAGDPPFLISSAFPRVGSLRFFPAPVQLRALLCDSAAMEGKKLKAIRFLSQALFVRAARGEWLDAWLPTSTGAPAQGLFLQEGALWMQQDEISQLPDDMRLVDVAAQRPRAHAALSNVPVWRIEKRPHVTVDRVTSTSTIFHVGRTWFGRECGLWFGIQWRRPNQTVGNSTLTYRALVEQLLVRLGDDGLGGKRSGGSGQFHLQKGVAPFDLPDATPGKAAWLLSRVAPASNELPALLHGESVAYQMTSVAGWLRSLDHPAQRRKRLYMLEEGSWIAPTGALVGSTQDVRPAPFESGEAFSHPVYRYGYGLAVGTPRECTHG